METGGDKDSHAEENGDIGEILGIEARPGTNGEYGQLWCEGLMQYSWPGCLDTRLRGETAIRESHYYLITPGSGVVQASLL